MFYFTRTVFYFFYSIVLLVSGDLVADLCPADGSLYQITRFLLIRHGKTEWNAQGKIQGHSDIPLNEVGIGQAKSVAQKLADSNEKVDAIYSSDLQRAVSTAREISQIFNRTIITDSALREMFMGVAEGMEQSEYQNVYKSDQEKLTDFFPNRWDRWQHTVVPGAETIAETLLRLEAFLRNIARFHQGHTVVVVTHGAAIKTLIYNDTEKLMHAPNCCIAVFEYDHVHDNFYFIEMKKN